MTFSLSARTLRLLLSIPALTFLTAIVYYSPRCRFFRANDLTLIRALEGKTFWGLIQREWMQGSPIDFRPVTSAALWMESRLFHDDALGYYLTNFGLHSINAVLLFCIGRRFGLSKAAAVLGAGLFLMSPVPFRALLWISDVAGILTVGLVFASVLLWLESKGETNAAWVLSSFAAAAAMFAKESGVTAVAIPLLLDLALLRGRSLRRLWKYLPLAAALALYLYLSLRPIPGWREYTEVYRWGWHAVPNALYGLGFAILPASDWGPAVISSAGLAVLLAAWFIWPDRRSAVFIIGWMILAVLPTSPFRPTGFDDTGRYAYAWMGPLSLTAACWLQRDESRHAWARATRPLQWTGRVLAAGILVLMLVTTHRLARTPYRTNPGMTYFDYSVLSLMGYGAAHEFLDFEIGCPSPARVEAAHQWLTTFVRNNPNRVDWALPGLMAKGMTEWTRAKPEDALDSWARAEATFGGRQSVELLRGAPVSLERVQQVRADWVAAEPCATPR